MPISDGRSAIWRCGNKECGKACHILAVGIAQSSIGSGDIYPELQAHPRRGIPSHGRPDKQPEGGGEFFRSRGIGLEKTPGCFICGGELKLRNNIAAFVQCREAGERVVAMFPSGAQLDYRDYEPDRVQVKIGACDEHLGNLQRLDLATATDGVINASQVEEART